MYPILAIPEVIPAKAFEMSPKQARHYFDWFKEVKAERLSVLESEVRKDPFGAGWDADFQPHSLKPLGEWLASKVVSEACEPVAVVLQGRPISTVNERLTEESLTRCFDVGIYYGETLIRNNHKCVWDIIDKGSKNNLDYGHLVIRGDSKTVCNPVRVVTTIATGIVRKSGGPERLLETYHMWSKLLDSAHVDVS